MLRLEPLPRPGGHWPGLLPLLLALLGTTWAGVQPLQLQEHRVPMPGGKGATGVRERWRCSEGPRGLPEASSQALAQGRLVQLKDPPWNSPGA